MVREEADVELEKLPQIVSDAVKKAEPAGKPEEAATAKAGDQSFYVVDVTVESVTPAIRVKSNGTVISNEIEKPAD